MARQETRDLFGEPEEEEEAPQSIDPGAPLAERMRPRTIDEFVGQQHLTGEGKLVRRLIEDPGPLPSLILWGGPGTGKTTLGRLLAQRAHARFVPLSAVLSGVKDLREAVVEAKRQRRGGRRTVLFIDEIHRFNKSQQDALLPSVEDGTVSLVGATTENPSFEVNSALLSRSRVLILNPLGEEEISEILRRAMLDPERGLRAHQVMMSDEDMRLLAHSAGGDARVALTALDAATRATEPGSDGSRRIDRETLVEALGRSRFAYDKGGEDHYNLASALIKSLRNSDADAGLYWLARLIEGGADPVFIARRLCILASEDVGLADPQAMVQAAAAAEITRMIGLPEALYPLSQLTIYLARAPKSDIVKRAYHAAAADAAATPREPVPLHLRNAVTPLMKASGYAQGYRYVHNDPKAKDEMPCLPEPLRGHRYVDS
ncbi:replication-associated recombination protein A [Singulisphaera acidiphila]|uniref:Replication-associated recombination protein A n=1 Tax=Singulisphaera acidiphila (strain ATCC BAA-1392 / DSM 18658 / VKM B-2454 / MOB10) TaxID=886293 RepID=L0DBF5_SINAD|nr:replication-associated recombination protein A [Singulisphaera acidiphila]AGA26190.1 AAA ATPase [Singulisphaera acidiphila DSM 18658]